MDCYKCNAETPWMVYGITGNILLNMTPVCNLHLVGGAITAYKTRESFLGGGEMYAEYVVVAREATPEELDKDNRLNNIRYNRLNNIRFVKELTERANRVVWNHMVRHGISKERYPNFNSQDDFVRYVNAVTNMDTDGTDDVPVRRREPVDPDDCLYTYVQKGH